MENANPLIQDSILGSKYFDPSYLFDHLIQALPYIFNMKVLDILYIVANLFSVFFVVVIIYVTIRMFEIREKEHAHLHHEIEEYAHHQKQKDEEKKTIFKNGQWRVVLDHVFSENENDWKLAIIEADAMLFSLLNELGYTGETLGDKLKVANGSFRDIDIAWEIHNIRNRIAHEASSFTLSSHEAKRVISLYEKIFTDYGFI